MKQTAVQWLVEQIKSDQNQKALSASEWMQVIEQAKEMEKEQIINAHGLRYSDITEETVNGEEYYNNTYSQEPKKEYQPSEKYLKKQKELMEDFIWNKMNKNNQNK